MKTLLFVGLLLAAANYGIAAENSVAQDSIRPVVEEYETLEKVSDGKGGQSEFIQKRTKVKAIEFVDDKGQKIKEISIPETQIIDKMKKETKYIVSPTKKNIAITDELAETTTQDERWKTGYPVKFNNKINYYDGQGNALFTLQGVEYIPEEYKVSGLHT